MQGKKKHIPDTIAETILLYGEEVAAPARVCLWCWHHDRKIYEDNEAHVLIDCPAHGAAREDFIMSLSLEGFEAVADAQTNQQKLLAILGSHCTEDWANLGRFVGRVRQALRKSRRSFEAMQSSIATNKFEARRAAWRQTGKHVCRHGIFFARSALHGCRGSVVL